MSKLHKTWKRKPKSDFVIVCQAVFAVAALLAAVVFLFEYNKEVPEKNTQYAVMSRIAGKNIAIWEQQLNMRDPERLFGIGGFSALRPEREIRKEFQRLRESRKFPALLPGKYRSIKEYPFPASAHFATPEVPPVPVVKRGTAVITPDGEIVHFPALKLEKAQIPAEKTVFILYGKGNIRRFRIVNSCGSYPLDMRGGNTVKDAGLPNGTYTVVWSGETEVRL